MSSVSRRLSTDDSEAGMASVARRFSTTGSQSMRSSRGRRFSTGDSLPDEKEIVLCSICRQRLGKRFLRPRHHCRSCASAVCDACSPHRIQLTDSFVKDRLCSICVSVISVVPDVLAQQNEINRLLHDACGTPMVVADGLSDAVAYCEQAAQTLIDRQVLLEQQAQAAAAVASTDARAEYSDTPPSEVVKATISIWSPTGMQRRLRWCRTDGLRARVVSQWLTPHQVLREFQVMKYAHGFDGLRLRLEVTDPMEGILFNSVADALTFVERNGEGLFRWMWGDVTLPWALCNPLRWSELKDAASTIFQLRCYTHGLDSTRPLRIITRQSHFLPLEEAIHQLNKSRRC